MLVYLALRRITKAFISFVMSGIDYGCYVVEEFRNNGKDRSEWAEGQLASIEPMPTDIRHTLNTSTGKINIRMMEE